MPLQYFLYLREKPALPPETYHTFPASEYLCFRTQLLHPDWTNPLRDTRFTGEGISGEILALEFEDNLRDWSDAWYEIQIPLREL